MRGIDVAFERLGPVALLEGLGSASLLVWSAHPLPFGEDRHLVFRAQVGPDDVAYFAHRVGAVLEVMAGDVRVGLLVRVLGMLELLVVIPVPVGPFGNPERYTNATEETRTMATMDIAKTAL